MRESTTPPEASRALRAQEGAAQAVRVDEGAMRFVDVQAVAPEGYTESCLRPLGLYELGGCCDSCWYGPNNPASPLRRR